MASLVTRALDGRRKALEGGSLFVDFMMAVRGVGRDTFIVRREGLPRPSLEIPAFTVWRELAAFKMFSLILFCELARYPWEFLRRSLAQKLFALLCCVLRDGLSYCPSGHIIH